MSFHVCPLLQVNSYSSTAWCAFYSVRRLNDYDTVVGGKLILLRLKMKHKNKYSYGILTCLQFQFVPIQWISTGVNIPQELSTINPININITSSWIPLSAQNGGITLQTQ